jgi:superfamily II DNA/RNA helicase
LNKTHTHKPEPDEKEKEKKTWEDLGLRKTLVEGLVRAYPEVVAPTPAQTAFIPAILEGRDVLVKDEAGSGKCVIHFN